QLILVLLARDHPGEARVARPFRRAHFLDERAPLLIGLNRNSYPVVITLASISAMRRPVEEGHPVSISLGWLPGDLMLDDRSARQHQTGLALRHVDVTSDAGFALPPNRRHQHDRAEVAGRMIEIRVALSCRWPRFRKSRQIRQSRERLCGRTIAHVILVGAGLSDAGGL